MRKFTVATALAFALGTLSQGAFATGCSYQSYSKKNDLEPPAPTAAVVKKQATQKGEDS